MLTKNTFTGINKPPNNLTDVNNHKRFLNIYCTGTINKISTSNNVDSSNNESFIAQFSEQMSFLTPQANNQYMDEPTADFVTTTHYNTPLCRQRVYSPRTKQKRKQQ